MVNVLPVSPTYTLSQSWDGMQQTIPFLCFGVLGLTLVKTDLTIVFDLKATLIFSL